jgi:hypothetical protein
MEKLKNIVEKIIEVNPKCMISGSYGLYLQGIATRNKPKDLDIFIPYGVEFILPVGMSKAKSHSEDYEEDEFLREPFTMGGISVDVFTPENEYIKPPEYKKAQKIIVVEFTDIIRFKLRHAYGQHYTSYKHKDDIIHLMVTIGQKPTF